ERECSELRDCSKVGCRDRSNVEGLGTASGVARRRRKPFAKRRDCRGRLGIQERLESCGLGRVEPEDEALLADTRERRREGHGCGEMGVEDIRGAIENAHLKRRERDGIPAGLAALKMMAI